jgi:hypothetical protein
VKFVDPISNFFHPTDCLGNQECACVEMEYLFMANNSQHQRANLRNTELNNNCIYADFDVLIRKSKSEAISGGYKKNVVPE